MVIIISSFHHDLDYIKKQRRSHLGKKNGNYKDGKHPQWISKGLERGKYIRTKTMNKRRSKYLLLAFKTGKLKPYFKGKHLNYKIRKKMSLTRKKLIKNGQIKIWNKNVYGYTTSRRGMVHSEIARKRMKRNQWSKTMPRKFKKHLLKYRPNNPTKYEEKFHKEVLKRNIIFKRQYKIGTYCVDFCHLKTRTVIEINGYRKSLKRYKFINSKHFRIIDFWNYQLNDMNKCFNKLKEVGICGKF